MKPKLFLVFVLAMTCIQCQNSVQQSQTDHWSSIMEGVASIEGKEAYLSSPFVTAGDRLYMVGHQDGSFPDHGWHVKGEMGGIWNHPIKLMDGFVLSYPNDLAEECLTSAYQFVNYPFANLHRYHSPIEGLEVERFQFVPDQTEGIFVEYDFYNRGEDTIDLPLSLNVMVDLRPVWLGERSGMIDGPDKVEFLVDQACFLAKDSLSDWYVAWKTQPQADLLLPPHHKASCQLERRGKGIDAIAPIRLRLAPQSRRELRLFIASSYESREKALAELEKLENNYLDLLKEKKARYEKIEQLASIDIPDKEIEQAYNWTKYNTDWLIREVPELGRALSAGMADYPWWFGCDNTYSLQGVLATGRQDIAISTLRLLRDFSEKENGNGRLVHEVSTNGVVFNPGNINETPHFVSMIRTLYDWTGDKELLAEFYPFLQRGMNWLLRENDKDGNLLPDGFGMMEIHGLNSEMIDVAAYTQQAFADLSVLASVMGEKEASKAYREKANALGEIINTDFWVEEFASYADFIGTAAQARELMDDAIVRADTLDKPWAVEELKATKKRIAAYPPDKKQGFVLYHNWVVNTPMELGIADTAKALKALETGSRFVNPFGVFVTGIDRDESAGSDDGSFAKDKKIFSYTGAVMTLPTGVMAIAENNYGRPGRALDYLKRMTRSFSYALPGSMYEVSPDFGMMAQEWNIYALNYPIVSQFFGIKPDAYQGLIRISPQMPGKWNEARISRLRVGENEISLSYRKQEDQITLNIEQSNEDGQLLIDVPGYPVLELIQGKHAASASIQMFRGKQVVVKLRK